MPRFLANKTGQGATFFEYPYDLAIVLLLMLEASIIALEEVVVALMEVLI